MTTKKGRSAYYVPPDAYIEGHGFRIAVVFEEDSAGYYPTGDWPYDGKPGQTMPYFARTADYDEANKIARGMNERLGLSPKEAAIIIARSMMRANLQPRHG